MLIINVVFAVFLLPVEVLKYRIKNKKGSPSVILLVSSKKVVFGILVTSSTLCPGRLLKATIGQELWR